MEREPFTPTDDDKKKRKLRAPLPGIAPEETADAPSAAREPTSDAKPARDLAKLFERTGMDVQEPSKAERPTEKAAPAEEEPADPARTDQAEAVDVPLDVAAEQEEVPEAVELSADEQREAATRLVQARSEEVTQEQQAAPADTLAANAANQAGAFLQAVDGRLQHGEAPEVATAGAYEDVTGETPPPLPGPEPDMADLSNEGGAPAEEMPPDDDTTVSNPYVAGGGGGRPGWAGRFAAGTPGWAGGVPRGGMNAAPANAPERVVVNGVASGLLVGGIVGYLLGRRRGRIRTERELLPIQHKLEREVQALSDNLAVREAQVRQLTWERAAAKPEVSPVAPVQEATPVARVERPTPAKQEAAKSVPKTVEKLHLDDVLKISETIVIGSTTIRKVFETNLISERGLRRVVDEHLRGGDTRKVLTEELLIKEMSHELDPQLRDRGPEPQPVTVAGAGNPLVPSATVLPGDASAMAAQSAAASAASLQPEPRHERSVSPVLVVANIIALVILAALLVTLLLVWLIHS